MYIFFVKEYINHLSCHKINKKLAPAAKPLAVTPAMRFLFS